MKNKSSEFKKTLKEELEKSSPKSDLSTTKIEIPKEIKIPESSEDFLNNRQKIREQVENLLADTRTRKDMLNSGIPYHKDFIKQNLTKLRELLNTPLGKGAKKVISGVGLLGAAADALAGAEDIADEQKLLEEREKERIFESLPLELKEGSKKISDKRIKPEELLQPEMEDETQPMFKQGLKDDDTIINYNDYLQKRKKLFGYE